MNQLEQQVLVSRVKSYLWRASGVGVVALLGWAGSNVADLQLPTLHLGAVEVNLAQWLTVALGLVVGELTKYYNVNKPWMESQLQ